MLYFIKLSVGKGFQCTNVSAQYHRRYISIFVKECLSSTGQDASVTSDY